MLVVVGRFVRRGWRRWKGREPVRPATRPAAPSRGRRRPGPRVLAMARVVVVGGGFGGLASAARLAKLGHEVTLVEQSPTLGGALSTVSARRRLRLGRRARPRPCCPRWSATCSARPGARWSGSPATSTWWPATSSASTASRTAPSLRLPGGSRAAQLAAFDALGPGLGEQWVDHVGVLLRHLGPAAPRLPRAAVGPRPWHPAALTDLLTGREMLHRRLRRTFRDERLRLVAGHPFVADGHDLRNVPAWHGRAVVRRAAVRRVDRPGRPRRARDRAGRPPRHPRRHRPDRHHRPRPGAARGPGRRRSPPRPASSTPTWSCARSTRAGCPRWRRTSSRTMPAIPPVVCHVGLDRRARPAGPAARGGAARRPDARGPHRRPRPGRRRPRGPSTAAAGSPRTCSARWPGTGSTSASGSSYGSTGRRATSSTRGAARRWACCGRGGRRPRRRLGPTTPVPGVYAAGAHATPGSGLPFVGLSAALVAQAIGPA